MNTEDAFKFADDKVFALTGQHLTDIQKAIFIGSWEKQKYEIIAEKCGYALQYIKNEGAELWHQLSQVLGETVTKTNFKAAFERHWQSYSPKSPQPEEPEPNKTVSRNIDFLGREGAIAHLNTLITSRGAKVIGIYGKGGIGKTTLARKYFEIKGIPYLELQVGMDTQYITSVESWVKNQLRHFKEEPEKDFVGVLEQFKYKLQNKEIGVLIDNVENALNQDFKFHEAHRDYVELLGRVLGHPTVKSLTLITSRERLNESKLSFIEPYLLPELDENAWREYFSSFEINTDSPALNAIHKAYGGNALVMKVLIDPIETDYGCDLDAYWQDNKDFLLKGEIKDLIAVQFDRLQKLDLKAYILLNRMGIYRYQNIPRVTLAELMYLLWDVSDIERKKIIESLQRRHLVEFHKGEYWLHPVIREEALVRLNSTEESSIKTINLLKREVDYLVNNDKIQKILYKLYKKSFVLRNLSIKQAAIRAFYLHLFLYPALIVWAEAKEIGYREIYADCPVSQFNLADGIDPQLNIELELELNLDRYLAFIIVHTSKSQIVSMGTHFTELQRGYTFAYDHAHELYNYLTRAVDLVNNLKFKKSLQQLITNLANIYGKEELINKFKINEQLRKVKNAHEIPSEAWLVDSDSYRQARFIQWWQNEGQIWQKQLRRLIIKYRYIGYDWQINVEEMNLISQYYRANELLADCLKNNWTSTSFEHLQIKHIEDELLLPIDEIDRRNIST